MMENNKKRLVEDIEYLKQKLPRAHINLYSLITPKEWEDSCIKVIQEVKENSFSTKDFPYILQKLVAKIKDSHTLVYGTSQRLPLYFEYISRAFYPTIIPEEFGDYLCKKLVAIDKIDIKEFSQKASEYISFNNEVALQIETARLLSDYEIIKYLSKSIEKYVEYTFINGERILIEPPINTVNIRQTSIFRIEGNMHLRKAENYYVEMIGNCLYIKYSSCRENERYPIRQFSEDIEKTLNASPSKIIFDLRDNTGGDSEIFEKLLPVFQKNPVTPSKKVYCLINGRTYSSALINTFEIKHRLQAIIVGQPAQQGYNHFGEVEYFTLPNSKLEIQYSTKYFSHSKDNSNSVQPDIVVKPQINDIISGNDVILNYCLKN